MKKQIFQSIILLSILLNFSNSYALENDDLELMSIMGQLAVSSPKRPSSQRAVCPLSEKFFHRLSSAPSFKRNDEGLLLEDLAMEAHNSFVVVSPVVVSPVVVLPVTSSFLAAMAPMDVIPQAAVAQENTPPRKMGASSNPFSPKEIPHDPLFMPSPKASPLRARNLMAALAEESDTVSNERKRAADTSDDDSEEEIFLKHPSLQKNMPSKRGRR
ncbi:MAG: hypothetical protein B7Y25_08355 [Alphaproteobacteria bacterium 16-39-46]|nr:MAG: hypothetical protein B7Y25_08355 [Alphaproteobacteria bacterium 16-39-46]OZA41128.1 MAG: hypothetical protein B7X84_08510 [Alphaproteobacteria bacterium 17-39-52]HQS84879.1 hypothetical protein [Alphaproteobacteria bacterium]HQS94659.1 hypothetical protein [Alphaproteobacteria bacterium]